MSGAHPPLRSFGRVRSRTIKPRQADRLTTVLPTVSLPDPFLGPIDLSTLMADARAVWLEIGFGGGEHLAAQAAKHPDVLLLGAEPFLNGAASALRHLDEQHLANVRIHVGDARDVVAALPDASLDHIFVLFPDPWPKVRHHKRRHVQDATVAEWTRVLKRGGKLRFATDWSDYAAWVLERCLGSPSLTWLAQRADDWRLPPAGHETTRYETKGLGDIRPIFFEFERL